MQQYAIVFVWGLLTVSAFVGWGHVVSRLAGRPAGDETDWGLLAGWGVAAALFIGGLAALLGLATTGFAISFVVVGVAAHFWTSAISRVPVEIVRDPRFLMASVAVAVVLVRYAAWVHDIYRNCNDDDIAYYTFVIRLLDTGTLIEPFSIRRMVSYGGQNLLQSLVVAVGSENNGMLMDRGIAVIINFGLALGLFKPRHTAYYAIVLIMIVILPFPTINSASHNTGLTIFLTLYRTLLLVPDPAKAGLRRLVLIGLVMAAAASLRTYFAFVVAVIATAYWLFCYLDKRRGLRLYVVSLVQSGLASSVFLAPWMILLYFSSNTALFPIFKGNNQPEQDFFNAPIDGAGHLEYAMGFLANPEMVFFIPLLFIKRLRRYPAVLSLYVGAVLGVLALLFIFSAAEVRSIARYAHAFDVAAFIVALAAILVDLRSESSMGDKKGRDPSRIVDLALIATALALSPSIMAKDFGRLAKSWGKEVISQDLRTAYSQMQAAIPKGVGFLAMVSQPSAFDYARNDIYNIDMPGVASPEPGMPFFKGAEALKSYLTSKSIRYIAYKDFERTVGCRVSIYNRAVWEVHKNSQYHSFRMQSAYYFDIYKNINALAKTEKRLYDDHGLRVIKLR